MTNTCPICFEAILNDKNNLITECKHRFHFSCIINNIKINNLSSTCFKCPLCRKDFILSQKNSNIRVNNISRREQLLSSINETIQQIRQVQQISNNLNRNRNIRVSNNTETRNLNQRRLNNRPATFIRRNLKNRINNMSYQEIKDNLKTRNLSTRGYKRDTLEKRLYIHMLTNREY